MGLERWGQRRFLAATCLLILTVGWVDGRAPVEIILAAPLLILQVPLALLPGLQHLRRAGLAVRRGRLLWWLVVAGPLITVSAAALSLLTCTGC